jgi:hypothetical protein
LGFLGAAARKLAVANNTHTNIRFIMIDNSAYHATSSSLSIGLRSAGICEHAERTHLLEKDRGF